MGAATAMIGIASDAAVPVVGSPHTKKLAWNHTRARKSSRASTTKHTAWMAASRRCSAQISTAKAASPKNEGVAVQGPGASSTSIGRKSARKSFLQQVRELTSIFSV